MPRNPDVSANARRIAIVGAGWAGLAAAFKLRQDGHEVQVFEQSPVLGGRARKAIIPRTGQVLDNGQHLMLGAYRHTLALMRDIGVDLDHALLRSPLHLATLDGQFSLHVRHNLPAALRLPVAILSMRGIGVRQKIQLLRALVTLQRLRWQIKPDVTVATWLAGHHQPPYLVRMFWEPLCIATLNTPLAQASMALFARVLNDGLVAGADASDLLIPRVNLSALWPESLQQRLPIHTGVSVTAVIGVAAGYRLQTHAQTRTDTHREYGVFDTVILATPPYICQKLLKSLTNCHPAAATGQACRANADTLQQQLAAFRYHAITTVTCRLTHALPVSGYLYMLREDRDQGDYGQWLFNRSRFMHAAAGHSGQGQGGSDSIGDEISIVISHADHLSHLGREQIAEAVVSQLRRQLPAGVKLPDIMDTAVITEKRATFSATPGLARPGGQTPWDGVFLAGDWIDTGYPGVLEGAVLGGLRAAALVETAARGLPAGLAPPHR